MRFIEQAKEKLPKVRRRIKKDHNIVARWIKDRWSFQKTPEPSELQELFKQLNIFQSLAGDGMWQELTAERFPNIDRFQILATQGQILRNTEDRFADMANRSVLTDEIQQLQRLRTAVSLERSRLYQDLELGVNDELVGKVVAANERKQVFQDFDKVIGMGLVDSIPFLPGAQALNPAELLRFQLIALGNKIKQLHTISDDIATPTGYRDQEIPESQVKASLKKRIEELQQLQIKGSRKLSKLLCEDVSPFATMLSDE